MAVVVAVPKEVAPGERRVALTPEVVGRLTKTGVEVRIEEGAGTLSRYLDDAYRTAGAKVMPGGSDLYAGAKIVAVVQPPLPETIRSLSEGTILVGFLNPTRSLEAIAAMKSAGVSAFAVELIPRISRAQSMDGLSSQATVAGYRGALLGAEYCPKFWPMLTTAAGTIRPATVLILGAGVAGLMAIATARRLGAVVEAYDVRKAAGEQVRSLGAKFLELAINAEGTGGYARELTEEEKAKEREMVEQAVARADVVITTAAVPGRKAPRLVSKEMVARMLPGAVLVDLAAESGGNCELTQPGSTVDAGGVTIAGPLNVPSQVPYHASQMYSKNLQAFLSLLVDANGNLVSTFDDEILQGSLLVSQHEVRYGPTKDLLGGPK